MGGEGAAGIGGGVYGTGHDIEISGGKVSAMGGAVSAEHGVGKLKAHFLEEMYGANHIAESARMKAQIDPKGQLGRGNLFSEEVLDAALAELA